MSILVYANFSICSSNVASKVAHTRRWKSHAVIFVRSPPHDNPKEIILEIIRLFWDSPPRKKNVQSIYNCYCHNLVFNSKVYGLTWFFTIFKPSSNHRSVRPRRHLPRGRVHRSLDWNCTSPQSRVDTTHLEPDGGRPPMMMPTA